jgi:hypothetical protein
MNDTLVQENTAFYRELVLADRCDRCGECSQAFVRAIKDIDGKQQELLFCGHHYRKYEPELIVGGWLIQDERNKINAKPMSGAPEGALTVNEE